MQTLECVYQMCSYNYYNQGVVWDTYILGMYAMQKDDIELGVILITINENDVDI